MNRFVGAAAVGVAAVVAGVVFLWPQSTTGYEPIIYGRDTCAYCRMHISSPGFAGELRDEAGSLTKYDDIGCMLLAMQRMPREPVGAWVEDHADGAFVALHQASLVEGEGIRTPMGYGIVAFASRAAAADFARASGARPATVEELLRAPLRARHVTEAQTR